MHWRTAATTALIPALLGLSVLSAPSASAGVDTSAAAIKRAVTHVQGEDSPNCRYREPSGSLFGYQNVAGTAKRKSVLLKAGATSRDLAIAMLENADLSLTYFHDNPYDGKSGDAANLGRFKQNWGMVRKAVPEYRSLGANDYDSTAANRMNSDLAWDVHVLNTTLRYYGLTKWKQLQRCGATGVAHPDLKAVKQYSGALDIITQKIVDSDDKFPAGSYNNLKHSDQRFWINVPAV